MWFLLKVNVPIDGAEMASSLLFELGTTGIITLDESQQTVTLGAYFASRPAVESAAERVVNLLLPAGHEPERVGIEISEVPEQDWLEKWKEGFDSIEIGDRLLVSPSWKQATSNETRVVVRIDPGMAFGTGTHETTRLCLEAIERFWQGGSFLDVGTGTGILAIAAALLVPGSKITAIDVDPAAVEVARENIAINGVAESIDVLEGQIRGYTGGSFDMVAANLTAEAIVDIAGDLAQCLSPTGILVLSGILIEFADEVERATVSHGLVTIDRRTAGEWAALVTRREHARSTGEPAGDAV